MLVSTLEEISEMEIVIVKHLETHLELTRKKSIVKVYRKNRQRELDICASRYFSEFHSQRLKAKNWIKKGKFFLCI